MNSPSPSRVESNVRFPDLHNRAANEWPKCDTRYAGEPKQRHRQATRLVAFPDIADTAAHNVDGDGGRAATEETGDHDGREVICKSGAEQEQLEDDVADLARVSLACTFMVYASDRTK